MSDLEELRRHVWIGSEECGNCHVAYSDEMYSHPDRYPCPAVLDWSGWVYSTCDLRGHPASEHWHPPVGQTPPLSNPTSSVSTEGVAEALAAALHDAGIGCMQPFSMTRDVCVPTNPQYDNFHPASARAIVARTPRLRLTAINPDSPVEPDRG